MGRPRNRVSHCMSANVRGRPISRRAVFGDGHRGDAGGIRADQVEAPGGASREGHEMNQAEPFLVEDRLEVSGVIGRRVPGARRVARATAAHLHHQEPAWRHPLQHLAVFVCGVGESGGEQDRRTAWMFRRVVLVPDPKPAALGPTLGPPPGHGRHHARPPARGRSSRFPCKTAKSFRVVPDAGGFLPARHGATMSCERLAGWSRLESFADERGALF